MRRILYHVLVLDKTYGRAGLALERCISPFSPCDDTNYSRYKDVFETKEEAIECVKSYIQDLIDYGEYEEARRVDSLLENYMSGYGDIYDQQLLDYINGRTKTNE